jgi:hypothetical protein
MSEEHKKCYEKHVCICDIFDVICRVFAIILSWSANHSFLWCVVHSFFGWWYVLYYFCVHGNLDPVKTFLHSLF